ncbi:hypothetical protein VOLCADRAFT_106159 [Volvox carteri f. nagariensis]|uniref:Uncharacterized protein n=1 Tax=Volvox carteri f. nagariensis TaxID=3068 RepID=D8U5G3_VOLCA|nr:uncharacterized protein VOLCADRAFT_106159 [Volvox carteri f. nagariensis]EFJ44996.1 hypothetical protein VOLCADRAFT_106159 [Volvox carteri f. nagariensis]|eukprot:XP_002953967.1 hypothetical protein VOLCADRAFT_106159 [Volvox carteri f. nagariensis]
MYGSQSIRTAQGTNQCIDVAGGLVVNGARLVQARCNASSPTQKFITLDAGGGVLHIYSDVDRTRCWNAWPLYDRAPPSDYGSGSGTLMFNGAVLMWDCDFTDPATQFKPTAQGSGWSLQPLFSSINCVGLNTTTVAGKTETRLVMLPCGSNVAAQTLLFTLTARRAGRCRLYLHCIE